MQQFKITPSVTTRTQTVEDYLRDLGKLEMVSPEEETELAGRIKAGDGEEVAEEAGEVLLVGLEPTSALRGESTVIGVDALLAGDLKNMVEQEAGLVGLAVPVVKEGEELVLGEVAGAGLMRTPAAGKRLLRDDV